MNVTRACVRVFVVSAGLLAAASISCGAAPPTPPPVATLPVPPGQTSGGGSPSGTASGEDARAFIDRTEAELKRLWTQSSRAAWINENFITEDTDALSADAEEASMAYLGKAIQGAARFDGVAVPEDVARKLKLLKIATVLPAPGDAVKRGELAKLSVEMKSLYGKGKYCPGPKTNLKSPDNKKKECWTLEDLSNVLSKSRSYDEQLEAWLGWHSIAPPIRRMFSRYVQLGNEGAKEIGFANMAELWKAGYDMSGAEFEAETDRLWSQVKPLYDELHCYVRGKLRDKYGKDKIGDKAPIPAHLLGNMWAQEWANVYDLVEPFKGQPSLDVTAKIKAKKLDEKAMVKIGERFFTSLGLEPLPDSFWKRSLFKKPEDREVVCHASAWDLTFSGDIRIKMCVEQKEEDLYVIHHELGHDYYYQYYKTLPILFQQGANDGFHEGIGDTIALSVTPGYLKKIGLLDRVPDNDKAELNYLLKTALSKIAFLPFGKLIDQWRWDVFSGKTPPDKYNESWWALRRKYQGVVPGAARSEADFDPGAKFHVPANVPYTRYFLAAIYQFQFHRALCKAAGHTGPLTKCSIFESKAAGDRLKAMLAMGASKPWPKALEALSGETKADATAIIDYFAPLMAWLKKQNQDRKETCGW